MNCPSCKKEIVPDSVFCSWCSDFVPSSGKGKKANLFRRWVALALDPLIAVVLYLVGVGIVGSISKDLGIVAAIGLPIVYLVWFLGLLRQGLTPGKKLLGLQVVDHQTGTTPGFGKMFVRAIVGRFISGLFFGLGYFWAISTRTPRPGMTRLPEPWCSNSRHARCRQPRPRGRRPLDEWRCADSSDLLLSL